MVQGDDVQINISGTAVVATVVPGGATSRVELAVEAPGGKKGGGRSRRP